MSQHINYNLFLLNERVEPIATYSGWLTDHTDQFQHHNMLAAPTVLVWKKVVDQHLFLYIILSNPMAITGEKVWCDRAWVSEWLTSAHDLQCRQSNVGLPASCRWPFELDYWDWSSPILQLAANQSVCNRIQKLFTTWFTEVLLASSLQSHIACSSGDPLSNHHHHETCSPQHAR